MPDVRNLLTRCRRGSAIFMLLTIVGVLYIFGTMLINYMTQERAQTARLGESMQAFYLAESAVEKGMIKMRELFSQKLLTDGGEINDKILALLDIDRAENFSLRIKINDGELITGGSAEVLVEVNNLRLTPFKTYIDEYEEVPAALKVYRKENRDTYADKALGGWEGLLRFEATGRYRNAEKKIEVIRELKVTDLTPPAENYTLFVSNRKDEYLRHGEFRCRNWSVVRELKALIDDLAKKTRDAFQETLGNTAGDFFWEPNMASNVGFEGDMKIRTLKVIRKLVMSVSDIKIKDFVDISIQKLHPYLWGKIRTNGRLHVYLPFFAADDIINYFEDNSIFSHQRPEIGYLFCSNQLHDPYLSKYTYYEGEIIRYYQKLKPYVLGITETPYPSSDPYTMNTKFDFVSRHPDKLEPMQLDRIKKDAKDYCHEFIER
ncbi:MAG TPA: pilus assembly PilX N-terminal domain-containing protein, partial [Candidatus Rifleibacterium sp.]|nr:pilus assembly PilX N-terminal domain-containing protein [Candidatus Rifleibacterium sp.]